MAEGLDILFLSGVRWEFSFQRHQQIAQFLARRNRVLFMEIGLSPANLLKEPAVTVNHWKNWRRGIREIRPNLFRHAAPPLFPLNRRVLAVNRINQGIIFRSARRAWKKLGMASPLFWISDPYFSLFARDHGQPLTVFDWIHDDAGAAETRLYRVYRRLREETLRGADIVFTPSRVIYDRHGREDPRFHLVPHGVDFQPATPGPGPEDISGIPSPIIGFVGTIGEAVDLRLLESLADKRKDWSFVLIGEVRKSVGNLRGRSNVHFLGQKKREDLPRYLSSFSAGMIPYRINSATETVHPVKTYEYLAAGIAVVSTRLPELLPLEGVIHLERDAEGFLQALDEVLGADSPEGKTIRMDFARKNTWKKRVGEIERIISGALPISPPQGETQPGR